MGQRGPLEDSGERVYPDVPFRGGPSLGRRPGGGAWPAATSAWWKAVASLPHAVEWIAADWEHLRMTALVHARIIEGDVTRAVELRYREERMGATAAGRARLKIRYEKPDVAAKSVKPARVLRLVADAVEG